MILDKFTSYAYISLHHEVDILYQPLHLVDLEIIRHQAMNLTKEGITFHKCQPPFSDFSWDFPSTIYHDWLTQ